MDYRRTKYCPELIDVSQKKKEVEKLVEIEHPNAKDMHRYISDNSQKFKLEFIKAYALYEEGAFAPNKYNRYDGTNDYQFMLDMFNKRNKSEITEQQHRKIRGLIAYSIKPFLRERLKYK